MDKGQSSEKKISAKELTAEIDRMTNLALAGEDMGEMRLPEAQNDQEDSQENGRKNHQNLANSQADTGKNAENEGILGENSANFGDNRQNSAENSHNSDEKMRGLGGTALNNMNGWIGSERTITPGENDMGRDINDIPDLSSATQRAITSTDEVKRIVAEENGYVENTEGNLSAGENVVGGESHLEIKERTKSDKDTAKIQTGEGLSDDQRWQHAISVKTNQELTRVVEQDVADLTKKSSFKPADLEKMRFGFMLKAMEMDEGYKFGERN